MNTENQMSIIVRDFVVPARIGIYPHEHGAPQRICVSVTVQLAMASVLTDDIASTMSYEGIVDVLRGLCQQHFNLVETLAAYVADYVLADARAKSVWVRVEKLDVFPEGRVGTELTRVRS